MPRRLVTQRAGARSVQSVWYPEDLLPQLQHTLAALADVECRYEAVREELEASPKPKAAKNRLLAELDEQRQHEKEPLHRKLAELHFRILNVAATQEICLAG
jgi:hypothetical protein